MFTGDAMPRGFTDKEKESIRQSLLIEGRRFLESYGIRKTNIEDLTQAAHISKGAFYSFFSSKEELFLEVLEAYEEEFRADVLARIAPATGDATGMVRSLLSAAFAAYRSSPLFKNFGPQDYDLLIRKLPAERVKYHLQDDDKFIVQIIAAWQAAGVQVKTDPQLVAGVTKALFYVSLHADEIGDAFQDTLDLLIDLVAQHLTTR
jgi:AcrR family transcriptional regulator